MHLWPHHTQLGGVPVPLWALLPRGEGWMMERLRLAWLFVKLRAVRGALAVLLKLHIKHEMRKRGQ